MGDQVSPWLVIPARGLAAGKTRLAAVLTQGERHALNARLLGHVLGVIGTLGALERCLVVSPCEETLALARSRGAATLHEQGGADPLNAALEQARDHLRRRGVGRIVVLPADLPSLSAQAVRTLLELSTPPGRVVIAPDIDELGTNALALDADMTFDYRFGVDSFARHLETAEALDLPVFVHRDPALAFDLDTPADYRLWSTSRAADIAAAR